MGRSVLNKFSSSALVCGLDEKEQGTYNNQEIGLGRTVPVQREEHSTRDTGVSAESFTEFYHIRKDK